MRAVRIVVEGRVQGVGFRSAAQRQASLLGINGWVRNAPDGTVEIHAECGDDVLELFLSWCRVGPASARVDGIRVEDVPAEGSTGFTRR